MNFWVVFQWNFKKGKNRSIELKCSRLPDTAQKSLWKCSKKNFNKFKTLVRSDLPQMVRRINFFTNRGLPSIIALHKIKMLAWNSRYFLTFMFLSVCQLFSYFLNFNTITILKPFFIYRTFMEVITRQTVTMFTKTLFDKYYVSFCRYQ